jgi:hypothetical protein
MTMKTIRILILLFPAYAALGQHLQQDWELQWPGLKINTLSQAANGNLLIAGENTAAGKGRLLLLERSNGQTIADITANDAEASDFQSVTGTFDGRFAAAGTLGKMARIVWYNDRGQKVQERSFGGAGGKNEFKKIVTAPDGSLLAAGHREGRKGGDVWLLRLLGNETLWEVQLGSEEFETITGLAADRDGGFVFCGTSGKKAPNGAGDAYIAKADGQGKLLWKKFYGDKDWDEALHLTPASDGGYLIAGLTKSKGAGETDFWLIKTSRDGARQWDKAFGGKNADLAHAVANTPDGGFLLAGSSLSHRSGARTPMGLLVKTNRAGELGWEQYLGTDKNDELRHLVALFDGSFVAAGFSAGKAWAMHLNDPAAGSAWAGIRDVPTLQMSELKLQTPDETLRPGVASWLALPIENNSDMDIPELRIEVSGATAGDGLSVWSTNYAGTLAKGERRTIAIPVESAGTATEAEHRLRIEVAAGAKSLKTIEKTITVRRERPAELGIADYRFAPGNSSDEVLLTVQLTNSGDIPSGPVEMSFNYPTGIRAAGQSAQALGALAAHGSREVRFSFIKTPQFQESQVRIVAVAKESGAEKVRKTLEWSTSTGRGIVANGPIILWTDPAPHETGSSKVRSNKPEFEYKATILDEKPVKTSDIKVKHNAVLMEGSKFNEQDLSPPARDNAYYTHSYRNKIPLVPGRNTLQIWVNGHLSDEIEIEYQPKRANLHLLAIGAHHDDLKYTAKDAADFAAAFQNQGGEGRLFQNVITHQLVTPDKTDLTGIRQAFYDLAFMAGDQQISPNDVLLVFISSHGKISENRFKVLQTGYNPKYERIAVDYKTDILEVLQSIECKKLIFIDACHSGGAKEGFGAVSKAIVDLAEAQPGVTTLSSSSSTEKSYEDAAWGNGAFTKAILEAFANTSLSDEEGSFQADADNDGIIRLGELYTFLRRRVPDLVKTTLPNAPTSQTPFMPENQLDADLPIYLIR